MLAPRKTLWSTPPSAINLFLKFVDPLTKEDVLYDVGCGDGRVLARVHADTECGRIVGIEIDEKRGGEARGRCESMSNIEVKIENAMNLPYDDATVVFLYLIPRGLKIIKSVLLGGLQSRLKHDPSATLKICTYMSPFVGEEKWEKGRGEAEVEHQAGAKWPVFYYVWDRSRVERWEEEKRKKETPSSKASGGQKIEVDKGDNQKRIVNIAMGTVVVVGVVAVLVAKWRRGKR